MKTEAFEIVGTGDELLIIADHASNHVPDDIDLGIPDYLLHEHIAMDIGVAPVARSLAEQLDARAILAGVSRLVVDLNREPHVPGVLPAHSDGHDIPGNALADRDARMERFYHPYHAAVSDLIGRMNARFILSLHSFTPGLRSKPEEKRPWDIGILYNEDDRAARIAIPMLEAAGLTVGDQLPYSGKLLNATMNRHAEAAGIPYLGIEMRQDHVGNLSGQARFAEILAPVLKECRNALA